MRNLDHLKIVDYQVRRCLQSAASTCPYDFVARIANRQGWSRSAIRTWIAHPSLAPLRGLAELAIELNVVDGLVMAMLVPVNRSHLTP